MRALSRGGGPVADRRRPACVPAGLSTGIPQHGAGSTRPRPRSRPRVVSLLRRIVHPGAALRLAEPGHAAGCHAYPVSSVRIVHLTAPVFRALADGDLDAANAASPVPLSPVFAGPEWRGVWPMRHRQAVEAPASAGWVTGVIWDEERQIAVGRAGY